MQKTKLNNLIDKILVIFLITQPIFDTKFLYNSISTLIRVIIIFCIFLYYFFNDKNKVKYLFIPYFGLIGIYFIFHHLNSLSFKSVVPNNFNYSVIKEALYFVKMLTPFMLIYCLYKSTINQTTILNIIKYIVLIISLVIIISNLFVFSYGNYSDIPIKANFFEWFNKYSIYSYQDLASKGLFKFGNQISAILIIFLPFIIFSVVKTLSNTKTIKLTINELIKILFNIFILVFNIFALILLCTKVSVFGITVVFIYTLFTYCFIAFVNGYKLHIKHSIPIISVFLVYILLLPFNPMFDRTNERDTVIASSENFEFPVLEELNEDIITNPETLPNETIEISDDNIIDSRNLMIEFIQKNYKLKQLHEQFFMINYPYEYDPEFWYDFLQKDISLTINYRYIEQAMVKRVVEINNNKYDKWLGITNTRLQNIFNIEKDFVVQYYALGIIGTFLVFAPYFGILIYFTYNTLKNKFKNLNVLNLLAFITCIFAFGISFFSGNLLNSLSFTIYFSILFLFMIKNNLSN